MKARAQEVADLERERRELQGHASAADFGSHFSPGVNYDLWKIGIAAAGVFLRLLLRR